MFKKLWNFVRHILGKLIPEYTVTPLVCTLLFQVVVYSGTKLFMGNATYHNFESALDLATPFLPWTIIIYTGAFVFWYVSYVFIMRSGKENAFRFLCAHTIALVVIWLCFIFLPTTNSRPTVEGNSLWDWGMRLLYASDDPNNLFPSLHCEMSWICSRGLDKSKAPKWYKLFAYIFTFMIFISTLTTKQHIIIDVLAGWALAEITFDCAKSKRSCSPFTDCMTGKTPTYNKPGLPEQPWFFCGIISLPLSGCRCCLPESRWHPHRSWHTRHRCRKPSTCHRCRSRQ